MDNVLVLCMVICIPIGFMAVAQGIEKLQGRRKRPEVYNGRGARSNAVRAGR